MLDHREAHHDASMRCDDRVCFFKVRKLWLDFDRNALMLA
jgi:hypothetical protein